MKISIIVCTYNRAPFLEDLITSLKEQSFDRGYEIIVVDNNSTDNTREIVKTLSSRSVVPVRYFLEEKQGLSHARNRGTREAIGEIVAFIDDDAVAEKDWLSNLVAVYGNPKVGCSGGQIKLLWLAPRPDWLFDEMEGPLGRLDYGNEIIELRFPRTPFGGNISFRRSILQYAGGFSANLGRDGKTLLSNEELDICSRVEKDGWKILYIPDAVIHHKVPAERLKKQWFYRRMYWQGRSDAVLEEMKGLYIYGRIRDLAAGMVLRRMNSEKGFEGEGHDKYTIGYLDQILRSDGSKTGDFKRLRALKTFSDELIKKDRLIEDIYNSYSWRITAPLRKILGLFKK